MAATVLIVNSARRGVTKARPVRGPDGRVYPSLTQAALAHNRHPGGFSIMVHLQQKGWRFATREEVEAERAPG